MTSARADVPTTHGSRYLQQLCKHWSHKFEVAFTPDQGRVTLPGGTVATMTAHPETLELRLDAADGETLARMKQVLAEHLDRFAFRKAPLAISWRDVV